jgi:hypothetical protein
MNLIFQHVHTQQVMEVPEIHPGVLNFNSCLVQLSEISLHNWLLCETEPGYRGMPPAEEDNAA